MWGRFTFEHEWPAFADLYDLPWDVERGRNTAGGQIKEHIDHLDMLKSKIG
jgi:hypothetical protein